MKAKIYLLMLLLLATQVTDAQIMFEKHYGGVADDFGSRVLQMDDGGYLAAGITYSYGAGGEDIYLIKTDENGNVVWTKTYGGNGDEQPNAMKKTSDGNIIIAGETSSYGAGSTDCYLLKINTNGDTLWTKTYGGINEDGANDVVQTSDGGFLLIGYSSTYTSGFGSIYIIRTNGVGDTIWTKTFEKANANAGTSAIQLSDGGFFFCGVAQQSTLNTSDCYFIRTNSQGDTIWTKTYGGNNYDGAFQCYDAGDGLIISGTTRSFGAGGNDIFLSKFDYDGNNIWYRTYGGILSDYGGAFSPTNDNGYIITGYTESFGIGGQDVYLIKTDNNGDTLWTKTFGGSGDEWGGCVKQTSDNGYIISGNTSSFGNGYDVYLVKTNSDGVVGFQKIINQNTTCNVYPNPNNGLFSIQLDKVYSNVTINVIDINGRIVYLKKGLFDQLNTEQIKLTDVTEGLYFVHLSSKNINIVKKVIIQK